VTHQSGYGASLGGSKTVKRDILRVFDVTFYKYLRRLLVKTSPSGVFTLTVSLEAFMVASALGVTYGIGGR